MPKTTLDPDNYDKLVSILITFKTDPESLITETIKQIYELFNE